MDLDSSTRPSRRPSALGRRPTFDDFLCFERDVYGEPLPIPEYDPYLIRYGEYRFVLDELGGRTTGVVIDIGCEWNIFGIYLATFGTEVRAIDIDPDVWLTLEARKRRVESIVGRRIPLSFDVVDATRPIAPPGSVDVVIAVSSIEHMFNPDGDGDIMALDAAATALRPGGTAIITVPMSNGKPFREAPSGDTQFGAPYRLYDVDALEERLLSHPALVCRRLAFLAQTTPDVRYDHFRFASFWSHELDADQRADWAWATPMLAAMFNPIVEAADETDPGRLNTALVALAKRP